MEPSQRPRITSVRLIPLRTIQDYGGIEPAWDLGGEMRFQQGGGAIVEIATDDGLIGIGPAFAAGMLPAVREQLIGQDPFEVERHVRRLRYYAKSLPYQGVAGIDMALWDLIGKACGQPLYKLWGGGKEKVAAYASMVRLSTIEERVDLAQRLADEGWQAMKLRIHYETMREDIALVEAVRNAIGDRMEIMVDANQAQSSGNWQPGVLWDYRRALETARELERLGCYWLEEPLPRYYFDQLAALNQQVAIPIAGGENNPGLHELHRMLVENVYDVLQPESMVLHGISDLRKVGVLAEVYGRKVVPHHGGRGLGTIAHLHLVASWPHSPYIELLNDPPIGEYQNGFSILTNPPVVDSEGFMAVPQEPGLGVTVNPDLRIEEEAL